MSSAPIPREQDELERYFQTSLDLFCLADLEGRFLRLSPLWEETLGYPVQELLGRRAVELMHPEDVDAALKAAEGLRVPGSVVDYRVRYLHRDGSYRWLDWRARAEGGRIYATARDVTRWREWEQKSRLQGAALHAAANAIVITDGEGLIEWTNPAFSQMSGYSAEEAIGKAPGELLRSGEHDEDFYREMWATLLEGRVWRGGLVNRRKDGSLYHEEQTITPLRDDGGEITHFVAIKEDVTDRIRQESQLRQAQKMETVGRLAGGVAHDFNNLLTVITATAEMASMAVAEGDPLQGELKEIQAAADRAAVLTRQLLTFSRQEISQRRVLDLGEVVAGAERLLRRVIGEDVEMWVRTGEGVPWVRADRGHLEQVIMNLAVNARDAMPDGGQLIIETVAADVDEVAAVGYPALEPGRYVRLTVSDTGIGMDRETQERIFEPFFSTKAPDRGTGLGLSTVYGIVRESGGHIRVYSEPGRGSTFHVYLPAVEDERGLDVEEKRTEPHLGSGRILLVEDDAAVRGVTARVLTRAGYQVREVGSGEEALEALENGEGWTDLILTDVVLPGVSGPQMVRQARALNPEARVLFTSGYTADALVREELDGDEHRFVGKPYSAAELTRAVREALSG